MIYLPNSIYQHLGLGWQSLLPRVTHVYIVVPGAECVCGHGYGPALHSGSNTMERARGELIWLLEKENVFYHCGLHSRPNISIITREDLHH